MKIVSKAKPFIKWVGGKGQLIEQLDAQLPANFENWEDVPEELIASLTDIQDAYTEHCMLKLQTN